MSEEEKDVSPISSCHQKFSKGDKLHPSNHIVRYVPPKHIDGDAINGGAFLARPSDEKAVSYNWMEYYPSPEESQLKNIRSCARLKYAATGKLAQLNIEKVISEIRNTFPDFETAVHYDPRDPEGNHPADPSHAIMLNIPEEEDMLADAIGDLIRDTLIATHPTR